MEESESIPCAPEDGLLASWRWNRSAREQVQLKQKIRDLPGLLKHGLHLRKKSVVLYRNRKLHKQVYTMVLYGGNRKLHKQVYTMVLYVGNRKLHKQVYTTVLYGGNRKLHKQVYTMVLYGGNRKLHKQVYTMVLYGGNRKLHKQVYTMVLYGANRKLHKQVYTMVLYGGNRKLHKQVYTMVLYGGNRKLHKQVYTMVLYGGNRKLHKQVYTMVLYGGNRKLHKQVLYEEEEEKEVMKGEEDECLRWCRDPSVSLYSNEPSVCSTSLAAQTLSALRLRCRELLPPPGRVPSAYSKSILHSGHAAFHAHRSAFRSFANSCRVVAGRFLTVLSIIATPRGEIFFGAPGRDTVTPDTTVKKWTCSQSFPCAGRALRNAFLSHGPYPAKDKIHLARIIRRSYVGVELVQWLLEQCVFVQCRMMAARVWQVLLELGILHSVDQRVVFEDSNTYYQFSFEECDAQGCEFRSEEEWQNGVRLLLQLVPYVQFRVVSPESLFLNCCTICLPDLSHSGEPLPIYGHRVTRNDSKLSLVTSPTFVLVETTNESVCGGTGQENLICQMMQPVPPPPLSVLSSVEDIQSPEEDPEGKRDICSEILQMKALERLTSTVQNELAAALARKARKSMSEEDTSDSAESSPQEPQKPPEDKAKQVFLAVLQAKRLRVVQGSVCALRSPDELSRLEMVQRLAKDGCRFLQNQNYRLPDRSAQAQGEGAVRVCLKERGQDVLVLQRVASDRTSPQTAGGGVKEDESDRR
ncbi:hypothetical protein NFI96_005872 [Prochilodus magdalenae]|nr:hypothetical protein NFI96_005872 [Prochilodus magdalenae]